MLRGSHAAAYQFPVGLIVNLNCTPRYIHIFYHMYSQFEITQNWTSARTFCNETIAHVGECLCTMVITLRYFIRNYGHCH
jgi:hypothetical protein